MRPRTKKEKEVVEISRSLRPLSMAQIDKLNHKMFVHYGFRTKKHTLCTECGKYYSEDTDVCPHCGKKLKVSSSRRRTDFQSVVFNLIEARNEYNIVRSFLLKRTARNGKSCDYSIMEFSQNFIDESGKRIVLCKSFGMFGYSIIPESEISLKDISYYNSYCFASDYTKVKSITSALKQRGWNGKTYNYSDAYFIEHLFTQPQFEQVLKMGYGNLIPLLSKGKQYFSYIKIANRHKYQVKDPSMWGDCIHLMEANSIDAHNPKYLCPDNLKEWHDVLFEKNVKRIAKEEQERKRKELIRDLHAKENYLALIAKFSKLSIHSDDIYIEPIPTVEAVKEEGDSMHHCVFACGYYKKDDCLLLSAKNLKGERVETIEVDLKQYTVVQSRGVCNSNTPYHDEILSLMEQNMRTIQRMNEVKAAQIVQSKNVAVAA